MPTAVLRRRFTIDEYQRMGEAGIFKNDDRVELIDGEIIQVSPIGQRHAGCVDRLNRILVTRLGELAIVRVQGPIDIPPHSEPEPDITVLRPRADFYTSGQYHPGPEETLLVVEVSDTTLAFDRGVKLRLYARSGVPELWIVNLRGEMIEIYRDPAAGEYRDVRRAQRGETVSPQAFPEITIRVDDILG